ncbi:MAG: 4-hydroxy-3-methylbut-2-enyl diphosphate reductase [Fluviicola sp.]|nr:4-hydroxy-3-methylbut-2-enyl diphosphate reductase [Fluviicola sp.]
MKKFDIPVYYRSPIISRVKARRKLEDPRKKDFSPSILTIGPVEFIISRHFGFCYGVENAIEKSYAAINENPDKRIFLISQMIHNPDVNADLQSMGVKFIQDTDGSQLIPWSEITSEDIVIIPAFGTTIETEEIIRAKGLDVQKYNTTCPFVEKVWNRSAKLGESKHTIIIHGKHKHEETRATFSHSEVNSPSLIVKNLSEAKLLADYILGKITRFQFFDFFEGKISDGFDPDLHLQKIGVVNQTTMLASETQEIADFLKDTMSLKFGENSLSSHFADTRDTLCYATNDNQSATLELLNNEADVAIVVGGYNSSNTTHLVELLEPKFKTFFIRNENEIVSLNEVNAFNIHTNKAETLTSFLPQKENLKIIITSGASCPDSVVDRVIQKILHELKIPFNSDDVK